MRKIFIAFIVCALSLIVGCTQDEELVLTKEDASNTTTSIQAEDLMDESKTVICVYVCGQVVNEGVYDLESGKRICDAIILAGGFTEKADRIAINQAEVLVDGMQIYIPMEGEMIDSGVSSGQVNDGLVNINTATVEELMTLSGIGESRAEAIVTYRDTNGSFNKIEDLMKVEGIKEGIFNKFKDKIKAD